MSGYYNRASTLKGLQEIANERGADLGVVMKAVGLNPDILNKPDERIAFNKICNLFEQCASAWVMPDFALRLASYQHLDILGPVGLVTRMEQDLRGAIQAITKNLIIHSNAIIATLVEEDDIATVLVDTLSMPAGSRQYALLSLGMARNVIEQAASTPVDLIEVSIRQDAGGIRDAAEAYFHCPVRFGAEHNALYMDAAILDRRIERSDDAYHAIIERYLSTSRHEASGSICETVYHEIARQMEFGNCTLESLARYLRVEPRSLQRRLKREGASFRGLMDDWRRTRALSLITRTRLPLSEITLALGYSDQSVFSRAFQRWYGQSPLSVRQKEADLGGGLVRRSYPLAQVRYGQG
ncbi:MAG: AraC family transcriptional regulator ligand-binding domain-containing protein [Paracoccus sp. (in: a-proteobacteria)]